MSDRRKEWEEKAREIYETFQTEGVMIHPIIAALQAAYDEATERAAKIAETHNCRCCSVVNGHATDIAAAIREGK